MKGNFRLAAFLVSLLLVLQAFMGWLFLRWNTGSLLDYGERRARKEALVRETRDHLVSVRAQSLALLLTEDPRERERLGSFARALSRDLYTDLESLRQSLSPREIREGRAYLEEAGGFARATERALSLLEAGDPRGAEALEGEAGALYSRALAAESSLRRAVEEDLRREGRELGTLARRLELGTLALGLLAALTALLMLLWEMGHVKGEVELAREAERERAEREFAGGLSDSVLTPLLRAEDRVKSLERWAVRGLGISSPTLIKVSRETLRDLEKVHGTVEDLLLLSERREPKSISLERVLEAAVEEVEPGLLAQGVRVEREFATPLPPLRGEERAFRRALERILLRAGRSPLPGGRIVVRARRLEGKRMAEVSVVCGPDRLAGGREEGFVELAYRIIQKYRGHVEEEVRGGGENRITVLLPEAPAQDEIPLSLAEGFVARPESQP